jgi:hypothetical protein
MPETRTLALAGILVAAAAGLFLAVQLIPSPERIPDGAAAPLGSESEVAILVVHDKNLLREVRAAVHDDRVVAESEFAFALEEGRIVALESPYAGPLIGALGWAERGIELIDASTLGGRDPRRVSRSSAPAQNDLARLSKKQTLSLGEAIRVLNATR